MRYRFPPADRRLVFGVARAGQLVMIAGGFLTGLLVLDAIPSIAGAVVAASCVGAGCFSAMCPIAGRGIDEWLPVVLGWAAHSGTRSRAFVSSVPVNGWRARVSASGYTELTAPEVVLPAALRDVRIVGVPWRGRAAGVVSEQKGRFLTAVVQCEARGLSLLDRELQEQRLESWGALLSGCSGTAVRRVQWVERTLPAEGDEPARWLHEQSDPQIALSSEQMQGYMELMTAEAEVAKQHEILLAVQVDAFRAPRGDKLGTVLMEHAEELAGDLQGIDVLTHGVLSPGQIGRLLRCGCDPFAREELTARRVAGGGEEVEEQNTWPLALSEQWGYLRSDGSLHATYAVTSWPRSDVGPLFLNALLGPSRQVRAVSVVMEPIAVERSTRDAESQITSQHADREMRQRYGQLETARHNLATHAAREREAELAAGYSEVRLAGYVTVTGRDEQELRRSCNAVSRHANRAKLELRRVYGAQAEAFTFTLPLCRGLR